MAKVVVLDPGHGGKDPGGQGNGIAEKDIVLKIALATKKYLEDNFEGMSVMLTRTKDEFIELLQRSKKSNSLKASCFVSMHTNANPSPTGRGFESYKYDKSTSASTQKLQDCLHSMIMKHAPFFVDRGEQKANFSVLRNTTASAVLTESGFITNKEDSDVLKDNTKLNAIAKGHGEGIALFLGLKRKIAQPNLKYKVVVGEYDNLKDAQAIQNTLNTAYRGVTIETYKA
jgi:N-acetylmuramoyl-L-alanine amidase